MCCSPSMVRYGGEIHWWTLPNPFMSFLNLGADAIYGAGDDYTITLTVFLGVWAAAGWPGVFSVVSRQLRRFRPVGAARARVGSGGSGRAGGDGGGGGELTDARGAAAVSG
ncbi:MAG: hypothetical protein U0736_14750 [Gemmataceae bacterium]